MSAHPPPSIPARPNLYPPGVVLLPVKMAADPAGGGRLPLPLPGNSCCGARVPSGELPGPGGHRRSPQPTWLPCGGAVPPGRRCRHRRARLPQPQRPGQQRSQRNRCGQQADPEEPSAIALHLAALVPQRGGKGVAHAPSLFRQIDLALVDPRRDLCLRRDAGYVGQHHAMALCCAVDAGILIVRAGVMSL